jgi:hypothetical protein
MNRTQKDAPVILPFATLRVANAELSSRSNAWSRRCALRTSHSNERHFACMKAYGFRRLVPSLNSALGVRNRNQDATRRTRGGFDQQDSG